MDDEDIYEKFEVTDYDVENEFNIHRARRPTKEQQIYGMWADEEEEYEEKNKNKKDLKGIDFVTSKSNTTNKLKFENDEKDDELSSRPTFSNSTSFKSKSKASEDMDQIAGFRTSTSNLRAFDSKFCEFEKNTRGIGSKLLLKMGFQPGKGLGKDLQGISTPIELKPRLGKGAISYYGKESTNGDKVKSEKESEKRMKLNVDKRSNDRYFDKPKERKKVNYVYVSEEDLMPKTDTSEFNKLKIIDMTGPEEKIFEGYQEIHKTLNKTTFKSNENELKRVFDDENENSSDSDEQQQKKIKNQFDYERDRLNALCDERIQYQKEIKFYEQKKQSLELIIEKVSALNSSINELEEIIDVCKDLTDIELICEVFYLFGFTALKHDLRNWLPFDEPTKHLDNFKILNSFFSKKRQFYDQIVWHCWVPYVRMSIETFSDMRESAKMISFFDEWNDLISKWIIDILINQTVVSKLEQQVIDWNPLKDRILIHLWIHPWLPKIRAHELETILAPIRRKFANTLKLWNPFDDTVIIVLKPWQHVFGPKNWNEFIKESIIPKLEQMMSNQFIINPKKQDLRAWDKLFSWKDMLAERELILILKKYFFPKWLKVLFNWLDNEPNYKEVLDWYLGWKSKFPEEWFNKELVVCQGFTVALRMIEFCIDTNGKRMASFEFN